MPKATVLASGKTQIQRHICLAPHIMHLEYHQPTFIKLLAKK